MNRDQHPIVVTGSAQLIRLAVAQALDALLVSNQLVIVPDMVRLEVIRGITNPGAREVVNWIRANEPARVRVASTEVYEEFEVLRQANPGTRWKGRAEQAAAEVLSRELARSAPGLTR